MRRRSGMMADNPKVLQAANLVKLGMARELKECLVACSPEAVNNQDDQGRSFLHHAAAFGFEECIDVLLESPGIDVGAADEKGLLPLHYAAVHAQPMCAYNLAKAAPQTCLQKDCAGQTPADAAAECDKGEVLNAMLLACASILSDEAVASVARLLQAGAVPDTWAPNGSSALMLAASVDCTEGLSLLIEHGATIELQDALGRTALMFAAGSSAGAAVKVLLDAGASLAARDRRNKGILDYAGDDTPVRALLEERMSMLEAAAEKLQAALLASLEDERPEGAQQQAKAKRKKEKKGRRTKKPAAESEPVQHASSQAESCTPSSDNSSSERFPARPDEDACQQQGRSNDAPAKGDVLASGVAEAGLPTEDAPGATTDTDGGQTHSSSGEAENTQNPAVGLAGETTSEDEWKVVGKAARKVVPKTTAASNCALPSGPQQHKRGQQNSQKACKRCPSLASLTESSGTAESAESDHSVLSAVTVHPAGAHHKPLTPAGRQRAASTASSYAAQQHVSVSRPELPVELHGQSAVSTSSAAASSWAGRVAGGALACQQQDGRKHTVETAMLTPSTPDNTRTASSNHLYSMQQGYAGSVPNGSAERCLSSGIAMYGTCSLVAQTQQAGITTIPEEGVASTPHRASHNSRYSAPDCAYNRATEQSCCAAARAQSEVCAAEVVAAKQEASTLRAELQLLRAAMQRTKTAHQQEIAQLLQGAACHQAQLVREAVQAEKDAMAERLLQTFQSLKGLMHVRTFDERCNDAPKDIMAALLTPQPAGEPAALLGLASATQPSSSAAASTDYAAFVGDAGRQVYHDDAAATLGASLSGLVSGLSISTPFVIEASAAPVLPSTAVFAATNGSKCTEAFSFFST